MPVDKVAHVNNGLCPVVEHQTDLQIAFIHGTYNI